MKLYVNNQKIDIRDSEFYVSGSEKLYRIDFEFSPDWEGFIKTVIFRKGEDTQSFLLNEPFLVIPSAMLQYPGKISVGVYGQKGDQKKPTEWSCVLDVEDGCKDGNPIEDPDPTIYEQLLEKFELISELDATASVDQTVGEAEVEVTKTTVDDHYSFDFAFSGIKGETGETGEPGFSPSASVEKVGDTATITITDADGTTTAQVTDGYTPSASVSKTGDTATITITDADGTTTADVTDGEDGFSPIATVTKTGHVATISITDEGGTTTANIYDGDAAPQDWDDITNKPFETIGSGLTVDQQGELSADVISDWTDIQNKPFETLGNTLSVSSDVLNIVESDPTVPAWAKASNPPTYTKADVGLGNVDNTSDAAKPISTATQTALDTKMPYSGGQFTGGVSFSGSAALPEFSGAPTYLLGIEAFTSGGQMKWKSASSVSVGSASSAGNVTGTVAIANGGTGATTAANARANLGTPYMVTESYPALLQPDGTNSWIKVGKANTSYGLLPSQAGGSGSGHNYLGTSSWYWKYAYIDEIHGALKGNADTATKLGTSTVGSASSPIYLNAGAPTAATTVSTINSPVSRSSGMSIQSHSFKYWGRVGVLALVLNGDGAWHNKGDNLFTGTLASAMANYKPKADVMGTGYYSDMVYTIWLTTAGNITVRFTGYSSGATLASGSPLVMSVTYLF